jgi:hypothetical protein
MVNLISSDAQVNANEKSRHPLRASFHHYSTSEILEPARESALRRPEFAFLYDITCRIDDAVTAVTIRNVYAQSLEIESHAAILPARRLDLQPL